MRARGLKLNKYKQNKIEHRSRSVRARGLKPGDLQSRLNTIDVALRASAWIETFKFCRIEIM